MKVAISDHSHINEKDNVETPTQDISGVCHILRHFLQYLRASGSYVFPEKPSTPGKIGRYSVFIYCLIALLHVWFHAIRLCWLLFLQADSDNIIFQRIIIIVMHLNMVLAGTVNHFAWQHYYGFLEMAQEFKYTCYETYKYSLVKFSWVCIVCGLSFLIVGAAILFNLFFTENRHPMIAEMTVPWQNNPSASSVCFISLYISCLHLLHYCINPWVAFIQVVFIIAKEFRHLTNILKDATTGIDTNLSKTIREVRLRHNKVCQMVKKADQFFQVVIGFNLPISMVAMCIIAYTASNKWKDTYEYYLYLTILQTTVINIFIWSFGSSLVNSRVRENTLNIPLCRPGEGGGEHF